MEREIDNENVEETENVENAENVEETEAGEVVETVADEGFFESADEQEETEDLEDGITEEETEMSSETPSEKVSAEDAESVSAEETAKTAEIGDGADAKKKWIGNVIFYAVLALLLIGVFAFRNYWQKNYGGVIVDGRSMINTLYDGERLLMKYVDDGTEVERGDIIVVDVSAYSECNDVKGNFLIKRLIAIEGDKVRCKDGQIEICYAGTTEYQVLNETYAYYTDRAGYDFDEYVVGEDEIFFLGDNRNNSCDSRYNQIGGSHLDRLYKEDDIYGMVPSWALKHQKILEKIFF